MLIGYKEIEENIQRVIYKKFGLIDLLDKHPEMYVAIKEVDNRMLATETRDLMGHGAYERWGKRAGEPIHIEPIYPDYWWLAKQKFLDTFNRLREQCG